MDHTKRGTHVPINPDYIYGGSSSTSGVPPIPPWDGRRTHLMLNEVPLFLKRLYGVRTSANEVNGWAKKGLPHRKDPETRYYLKVTMLHRWRTVKKQDLMNFLSMV